MKLLSETLTWLLTHLQTKRVPGSWNVTFSIQLAHFLLSSHSTPMFPQLTSAMQYSRKAISSFFFFLKKKGCGREKQQGPQFFSRFNFHITHVSTCARGLEGSHEMGMSQASDKITSVVTWSAFYPGD